MKKMLVLVAAVVMVAGFSNAQAAGPFCFTFDAYCDGLELSLNLQTNVITGLWINTDCAGTDVPITWGKLTNGPLGYGAYVMADLNGFEWAFYIDVPMDGTMDMYQWSGSSWVIWIDDLVYSFTLGPCPFDYIGAPGNATTD